MTPPVLLAMEGIEKSFPGVQALRGVSLDLRAGEVLALLGENGAGKSTLMKILSGAVSRDAGSIQVNGHSPDPGDIAVIYQEFNLVPSLTARENIFLGRERTVAGFVRAADERRRARELFERIGVAVDPEAPCRELTIAQQQAVEIARALSIDARILVMDEPTAPLTTHEVERLFEIVRGLRAQGIGIIYISHRLDEIFRIADRITVLRDGRNVGTRPIGEVRRDELIEMMVGRKLESEFPKRRGTIGADRLVVRNLARGDKVRGVSFAVRRGEVLGLAGLVGSGRTETVRLIFGADRADAGSIELDGRALRIRNPRDAIRAGICLVTEDRKAQGLVLVRSVLENFALPNLRGLWVRGARERDGFARYKEILRIRVPHASVPARNLSGGNQQKVVLAKWLETDCQVVIFDEPTRGVDVGAKVEIYEIINDLAAAGKAVLIVSSELPEALGMCDRILVMHDGRIAGEIADIPNATQEGIMKLAVG